MIFVGDSAYETDFRQCLDNPPYEDASSCYNNLISSVAEINTEAEWGFLLGLCATKYQQPFGTYHCFSAIALRKKDVSFCEQANSLFDCQLLYYDPEGYVRRNDLDNYTLELLEGVKEICTGQTGAIEGLCRSMISQGTALLKDKGITVERSMSFLLDKLKDPDYTDISDDGLTWYTAAEQLGNIGKPAIPYLIEKLDTSDDTERTQVLLALAIASQNENVKVFTDGEYVDAEIWLVSEHPASVQTWKDWYEKYKENFED